jgi:hypothetical protein
MMQVASKAELVKKYGLTVAVLAKSAHALREGVREVAGDDTLQPVLDWRVRQLRRDIEVALLDAGLTEQAASLPPLADLGAAKLITAIEALRLPGIDGGTEWTRVRLGEPGKLPPVESFTRTLSQARVIRIAMQLCDESGNLAFDVHNPEHLEKLHDLPIQTLAEWFNGCELVNSPRAIEDSKTDGAVDIHVEDDGALTKSERDAIKALVQLNAAGVAFPKLARIATTAKIPSKTVRNMSTRLQERGYMTKASKGQGFSATDKARELVGTLSGQS